METVNERVFRLLGNERGTQKKFAGFIKASESKVNKWKIRGSSIDAESIPKIAEFLGVSETYLLTGEDQKESEYFTQEETKLIELYRNATSHAKELARMALDAGQEENKKGA